jgi:hypothetical protein
MLIQDELLAKYERDYSTDFALGQLSVVQILRETVAEFVSDIPEIASLPKARKEAIEEKIMFFALMTFDQGREHRPMSDEEAAAAHEECRRGEGSNYSEIEWKEWLDSFRKAELDDPS